MKKRYQLGVMDLFPILINKTCLENSPFFKVRFVEKVDVERGIRSEDVIERSIARIPMYQALNTIIIDTNAKDVAVIANEIKQL